MLFRSLVDTERALWHVCPCCVGNLSRTLLMIPTWTYVKDSTGLYVNMFVGSRVHVGEVAGTNVEVVQKTDYPWHGAVSITLNPERPKTFSVYVRIPDRSTSRLYKESPAVRGLQSLSVNGEPVIAVIQKGYAVVTREWSAGDRIELELPMQVQRVVADSRVTADSGLVALKYGPLVYNVEATDNKNIHQKPGTEPLRAQWRPDLLGGVMVITGRWADGSELLAIPNYARMNRQGPPHAYPSDEETTSAANASRGGKQAIESKVWI